MENLKRQFDIDYSLDWEYGATISKMREDLDAIEKLGATHVDITTDVSYDCAYLTIQALSERLETDEEVKERINEVLRRKAEIERRELETLEELKLKYQK